MRIAPGTIASPLRLSAEGPGASRAAWSSGQIVEATVQPSQGNLVRLTIGNWELWAEWPGPAPKTSQVVQLQIVGREQNVWQMALLGDAEQPVISLPKLLEQLGMGLTPANLQRLHRYLKGETSPELADGPGGAAMFPLDESAWQRLFGFIPNLVPAFLTAQPMPCGLFIEDQQQSAQPSAVQAAGCWLLAVDLPLLGPIGVVGTGAWPEQNLKLLARQETIPILRNSEQELRRLLQATGMQVKELTVAAVESPLLVLPTHSDLYVAGIDLKL